MSEQGWRTETDALDYFGNQRKQLQVADRRPVIRQASDLVGPAINASAVRITDFNSELATFNGYFSALTTAVNRPEIQSGVTLSFIGTTSMDSELGGVQKFVRLPDGMEFLRTFRRNPSNPNTIYWSAWQKSEGVPVGSLTMFAGSTPAAGWLLCNGQAVDRSIYSALFAVMGTTYGAGNGSTTFNLPNLTNRSPMGAGATVGLGATRGDLNRTLITNNLPSHSHSGTTLSATGAGSHTHGSGSLTTGTQSNHSHGLTFSDGTGNSSQNVPRGTNTTVVTNSAPVNSNGSHSHNVTGTTDSAADHTHAISGNTGLTGSGAEFEILHPVLGINFVVKAF